MSAQFSVMWQNNPPHFNRPMSSHTFRLRDLGLPMYDGVTVHVDQITVIFRPIAGVGAIGDHEYVAPDSKDYAWHTETDQLLLRCTPGKRHHLYVGDDPAVASGTDGTDRQPTQRVAAYSAALAVIPHSAQDESYWVRTYRPIRDLPVVQDTSQLTEWRLELVFPFLLGDREVLGTSVPDYRIHKVLCEFSVHW